MEITLGGWSAQYVREVLGLSEQRSILVLSLFWVGMVVARVFLTAILRTTAPRVVLPVFLGMAMAGSGLMLAIRDPVAAGFGLFLLGAGLSAGFPILLGFLGGLYEDLTGTAFSAVFVMALIGGSALPFLTGVLGDRMGLAASLVVVPMCLLAQGLLFVPLVRRLGVSAAKVDRGEGVRA
jgi:fucose permease